MMPPKNSPIRQKAYEYHVKGLNFAEIGKLLDLSPRTIERYSQQDKWKERVGLKTPAEKAKSLKAEGKTYEQIAQILNISRATVHNYLRKRGDTTKQ